MIEIEEIYFPDIADWILSDENTWIYIVVGVSAQIWGLLIHSDVVFLCILI